MMAWEDFYIDPETRDVVLDATGNLLGVDGAERVSQHIRTRLETRLGEYFRDQRVGLDYDVILGRAPDATVIHAEFAREIAAVDDVRRIQSLTVDLDSVPGRVVVDFSVVTTEGLPAGGSVTL